jgi:hypothetical protein
MKGHPESLVNLAGRFLDRGYDLIGFQVGSGRPVPELEPGEVLLVVDDRYSALALIASAKGGRK